MEQNQEDFDLAPSNRASRAYWGLGCFALLVLILEIATQAVLSSDSAVSAYEGMFATSWWSSLAYLALTAVVSFNRGANKTEPSSSLRMALRAANGLVLVVAIAAWVRGPGSRTLLVGFDQLLPGLAMVSGLAIAVGAFVHQKQQVPSQTRASSPSKLLRWLTMILIVASAAAASSLVYLELQPLPLEPSPDTNQADAG